MLWWFSVSEIRCNKYLTKIGKYSQLLNRLLSYVSHFWILYSLVFCEIHLYLQKRLLKYFKENEFIIKENLVTIFKQDFEDVIRELEKIGESIKDEKWNIRKIN